MNKKETDKKSIAMIIAFKEFRDEEYFIPKEIFEEQGIEVKTFSDSLGTAFGKMGGEAEVDNTIANLNPEELDAVVFVGGPGAINFVGNAECKRIIQDTEKSNKILAAICIAPLILAEAGALQNKKAVIWSSEMDKTTVKQIQEYGAIYEKKDVVVEGKTITGSGPESAEVFAKEIVKGLKNL